MFVLDKKLGLLGSLVRHGSLGYFTLKWQMHTEFLPHIGENLTLEQEILAHCGFITPDLIDSLSLLHHSHLSESSVIWRLCPSMHAFSIAYYSLEKFPLLMHISRSTMIGICWYLTLGRFIKTMHAPQLWMNFDKSELRIWTKSQVNLQWCLKMRFSSCVMPWSLENSLMQSRVGTLDGSYWFSKFGCSVSEGMAGQNMRMKCSIYYTICRAFGAKKYGTSKYIEVLVSCTEIIILLLYLELLCSTIGWSIQPAIQRVG